MIYKLVFLFFFSISQSFAITDPVLAKLPPASFSLDSISVAQVVRLIFSEATTGSYVLDPVIIADQRLITFRWSPKDGEIRPFLTLFLESLGYEMIKRDGVDYIRLKAEKKIDLTLLDNEIFVYKPRFRDGSYLVEILSPLFKGSFTSRRSMQTSDLAKSDPKVAPAGSVAAMIDRKTDTIVFSGSATEVKQLQTVLSQVDIAIGQVLVRGALYEVQTSSAEGSAFQLASGVLFGKFGLSFGVPGQNLGTNIGLKTALGALHIDAVLSALSTDSRFKVVSSPSLRVRDGATAKLSVGQEVPVLGALSYPSGAGQAVQSIEYRSSGVIFDLTPQIRDSVVDLNVMQQVSNFVSTTNGVNGSPTLTKRELQTSISVLDGDLVVIGGLNETKDSSTASGLPFLPSIFRSNSNDTNKSEILLILQVTRI